MEFKILVLNHEKYLELYAKSLKSFHYKCNIVFTGTDISQYSFTIQHVHKDFEKIKRGDYKN